MKERITPFLWFDGQAEQAANFYVGIFGNSKLTGVMRNADGSALTVGFELEGRTYTALNGGPMFKFNESVSFVVHCKTQEEVDRYWNALLDGGAPSQCGWLKDRYGLSWQIVPDLLLQLGQASDTRRVQNMMHAMMQMVKLDIAQLQHAYDKD